jgi:hypothetical protein
MAAASLCPRFNLLLNFVRERRWLVRVMPATSEHGVRGNDGGDGGRD